MSKEFDTKPIPPNCEEEVGCLIAEREYIKAMKFCKIALTVLIFLTVLVLPLIFCLGFVLSELSYAVRHQINDFPLSDTTYRPIEDFHQYVNVFDTEQKVEDYYETMGAVSAPQGFVAREEFALVGRDRPIVVAGPFTIFYNHNTGEFSVHDSQSLMCIVRMTRGAQYKILRMNSLLEEGWYLPRFSTVIIYSADGVYEQGGVSFGRGNGMFTVYDDSKGIGVFDTMEVSENGVTVRYRLNNLTWERTDEQPFPLPMGGPPPSGVPMSVSPLSPAPEPLEPEATPASARPEPDEPLDKRDQND